MIKKIILTITIMTFYTNISYAEKVECELLSPIQKAIYKAYCQAEAKKKGMNNSESTDGISKAKKNVGKYLKKLKINTDSTLFKTGKHKE